VTDLPRQGGAYLLVLELQRPLTLRLAGRAAVTLDPGHYAYCGSAYGPGGIAARVARHRRRDKALRWHIDRLTAASEIVAVTAVPGGTECALFDRVAASAGAWVPLPGFGSSDCRRCAAHLAAVPAGFRL
jgi:Uri superfamily endonuclease